jgi:hypothetical protein
VLRFFIVCAAFCTAVVHAAAPNTARAVAVLDRQVAQELHANKVKINPLADDATFVRRIYLDAAGRIPTREETNRFLNSRAPDKRARLISELLDSPAFVSRQYNYPRRLRPRRPTLRRLGQKGRRREYAL